MGTMSALFSLNHLAATAFLQGYHTWTLLGASLTFYYLIKKIYALRKGRYPPGPRGLPLVGNLFQLRFDAWFTFTEWKEKYGPIVYINVAGQDMVILNTHKAAADLLDRRAPIYSSRPRWIVASEILTGGLLIVFLQYNNVWRRMRRAGHEGLNKTVSAKFHVPQTREAILLVDGLLKHPDRWLQEIHRSTASMVWSVVYDKPPITDANDPQIAGVNDFMTRIVRAAFPGAHFVEYFTWMKYLPNWMAKWKRDAEGWYRVDSAVFEGLFQEAKMSVESGGDRPSFAASLARDTTRYGLSDRESAWLAAALYVAGAETTAAVFSWFMLAMVLYPEVQKKNQEELDTVVGRSRMPTFADMEYLPYLQATVREALRWHPIDPVGFPHQSTEDDWYEGYFIPKGTICIPNTWALNRDTKTYGTDASDFNPGRFLDKNGKLAAALGDSKDGHFSYGFGRRLCMGRHVANNSLFIDIACLLWAANITAAKDSLGQPVIPDEDKVINDGFAVRPIPFECSITPRFSDAEIILAQARELES